LSYEDITIKKKEGRKNIMKKSVLATILLGTMVISLSACGTPTETAAAPSTEAAIETTVAPTTETTAVETTVETTEITETTLEEGVNPFISGQEFLTNVQFENMNRYQFDGGDLDPAYAGETWTRWQAQSDQEVVITFESSEEISLVFLTKNFSEVIDPDYFTQDGTTYSIIVPANSFTAGDTLSFTFAVGERDTDGPYAGELGQAELDIWYQ